MAVCVVTLLLIGLSPFGSTANGDIREEEILEIIFAGGSGTEDDPYLIEDVYQLQAMNENKTSHYALVNDIDASVTRDWNDGEGFEPIGYDDFPFWGNFNGDGYSISGLYINRTGQDDVGLFGYLSGSINNVGLANVNITGGSGVGGLVGRNDGTVSDSYATGSVSGYWYVGGIMGGNGGTVDNSYATGNVSGNLDVGGIMGGNGGTVDNSYATGNVSGGSRVGGLMGTNWDTVDNSYATGNVSGDQYVGGLVGSNEQGMVKNSYATGDVSGDDRVGGFMGQNYYGTVNNSYATGTVTRKSDSTGTDFGGFGGRNFQGKINNCYSTGSVHYEGTTDPTDKGFAGSVDTGGDYEMSGNFWDVETSGQTDTAGNATGKTTAEMRDITTFADVSWDIVGVKSVETRNINHIWNIVDTETHPFLSWESVQEYALEIFIQGKGTTSPVPGDHFYTPGEEVIVEAIPDEGWYLSHWTGDVPEGEYNDTLEILMVEDKNVTAHFEEVIPPTVDVTFPDEGEVFDTDTVNVEWEVVEGTYPITFYEIQLNDGAWIYKGTNTSHTFQELDNRRHTVNIRSVDKEGYYDIETVEFEVDVRVPEFIPEDLELEVHPQEGTVSLEVVIEIGARNTGGLDGEIKLFIDDELIYTLLVPAYGTQNKSFAHTFRETGTYEIRFGELTETVVVKGEKKHAENLNWVPPLAGMILMSLITGSLLMKQLYDENSSGKEELTDEGKKIQMIELSKKE
ncbi:MAG: GLUG motif-containing protein [Thermoplasmata archaeon]